MLVTTTHLPRTLHLVDVDSFQSSRCNWSPNFGWSGKARTNHQPSSRVKTAWHTLWYTKTSFVSLPHAMYSLLTVSPTKFFSFVWPCSVRICKPKAYNVNSE
jgi:hypothetical protein